MRWFQLVHKGLHDSLGSSDGLRKEMESKTSEDSDDIREWWQEYLEDLLIVEKVDRIVEPVMLLQDLNLLANESWLTV